MMMDMMKLSVHNVISQANLRDNFGYGKKV